MGQYQVVLQFEARSLKDYDRLVAFETALETHLGSLANVDGHDFGSEEFNIFIFADEPRKIFEEAQRFLNTQHIPNYMRAAYRHVAEEQYVILWPPNLREFSVS